MRTFGRADVLLARGITHPPAQSPFFNSRSGRSGPRASIAARPSPQEYGGTTLRLRMYTNVEEGGSRPEPCGAPPRDPAHRPRVPHVQREARGRRERQPQALGHALLASRPQRGPHGPGRRPLRVRPRDERAELASPPQARRSLSGSLTPDPRPRSAEGRPETDPSGSDAVIAPAYDRSLDSTRQDVQARRFSANFSSAPALVGPVENPSTLVRGPFECRWERISGIWERAQRITLSPPARNQSRPYATVTRHLPSRTRGRSKTLAAMCAADDVNHCENHD